METSSTFDVRLVFLSDLPKCLDFEGMLYCITDKMLEQAEPCE